MTARNLLMFSVLSGANCFMKLAYTMEKVQADQQNPVTVKNLLRFPVFSLNKSDEKIDGIGLFECAVVCYKY